MGLSADSLELQSQEQAVGPFRADILCRDTENNSLVLIETMTTFPLDWDEKLGNKHSAIRCRLELDMRDERNWPEAHAWMFSRLLKLRETFRPLVRDLDGDRVEGADPT